MEILLADKNDIDKVMAIIFRVKEDMKAKKIEQWPENYPPKDSFVKAIERHELFVARIDDEIVACVILNHEGNLDYSKVPWKIKDKNPLLVHRLAVLPTMQGKGIAKEMMQFAEKHGREEGSKGVRLDTYSRNTASNQFYQKMGYKKVGSIRMPYLMPEEYFCYEKGL